MKWNKWTGRWFETYIDGLAQDSGNSSALAKPLMCWLPYASYVDKLLASYFKWISWYAQNVSGILFSWTCLFWTFVCWDDFENSLWKWNFLKKLLLHAIGVILCHNITQYCTTTMVKGEKFSGFEFGATTIKLNRSRLWVTTKFIYLIFLLIFRIVKNTDLFPSMKLCCSDTCQIWMGFKESNLRLSQN